MSVISRDTHGGFAVEHYEVHSGGRLWYTWRVVSNGDGRVLARSDELFLSLSGSKNNAAEIGSVLTYVFGGTP